MKWELYECSGPEYFTLDLEAGEYTGDIVIPNVMLEYGTRENGVEAIQYDFDKDPNFKAENYMPEFDDEPKLKSRAVGKIDTIVKISFGINRMIIKGLMNFWNDKPFEEKVIYWILTNPQPLTKDEVNLYIP